MVSLSEDPVLLIHLSVRFKRFYVLFLLTIYIKDMKSKREKKTSLIESALDPLFNEIQEGHVRSITP